MQSVQRKMVGVFGIEQKQQGAGQGIHGRHSSLQRLRNRRVQAFDAPQAPVLIDPQPKGAVDAHRCDIGAQAGQRQTQSQTAAGNALYRIGAASIEPQQPRPVYR